MKAKLIFLLVVVFSYYAKAQEMNCGEKGNQMSKYIANKEYDKALAVWNDLKASCPTYSEQIYTLSSQILQYNIEIASPENKEKEVRELIQLYDLYDKNFPYNQNGNFEKRAMALYDNKAGSEDEIYNFLNLAYEKQRNTFTNSQAIFVYFQYFFEKNKSDKSTAGIEKLLDKYNVVSALVENNSQKLPLKADEYSRVIAGLDSYMGDLLTCDNLLPYAQKNYEKHQLDIDWLSATAKALFVKCKSAPIFGTIATQLHSLQPTSKSAYYLATYTLQTGDQNKAVDFFTQSVSLATNKMEKATTAYTIASILSSSDKGKAKEMVQTAIENNPSNGKYFIFLANLYANSVGECGTNAEEKKAIYKLASDTVLKAIAVEPRLKVTCDKMSNNYLKNVVSDNTSKVKEVKIGCWINQTVRF